MNLQLSRFWGITLVVFMTISIGFVIATQIGNVEFDYTLRVVAIGGGVLGAITGFLGTFAVLREQSLVGDALSHAALPGVAIAFLIAGRDLGWLLIGAGIASWIGVMFINAVLRTTRIKQDAAMGMTLTAFFAIGIALLAYIQSRPDASQAGLDRFIFGQAASIISDDVWLITIIGGVAVAIVLLFWKEFKLITFDLEFASANGFATRRYEILLSTLIVVAIVLGLQLAGVILMVGLLIAPAVAARQWTDDLSEMAALAAVFGAFAGMSGAVISSLDVGLPTGPIIVVVAFVVVLVSLVASPERGLIVRYWRNYRDRRSFIAQNILRDLYAYGQAHDNLQYAVPQGTLVAVRGNLARTGLRQLEQDGFVRSGNHNTWQLTEAGIAEATSDETNQALWDLYRRFGEDLNLPHLTEDRRQDLQALLSTEQIGMLRAMGGTDGTNRR